MGSGASFSSWTIYPVSMLNKIGWIGLSHGERTSQKIMEEGRVCDFRTGGFERKSGVDFQDD